MKLEKKYSSLTNIIEKHKIANISAVKTCFSLLSAANNIDKACAKRLGVYQLSESRFMILALLFEYNTLSPLTIAKLIGVTKPTITSLIISLQKEGLIQRKNVPEDGRKYIISLTEQGEKLIKIVFHQHSRWIANITKNITNSEMETLIFILDKIRQNTIED